MPITRDDTCRVLIELTEERAVELAEAINTITWCETDVENELSELYAALGGSE